MFARPAAAIALASLVADDPPPAWLAEKFESRRVEVGLEPVSVSLLDDGVVDLVARCDADGLLALDLCALGTILTPRRGTPTAQRGLAHARFAALSASEWHALAFDSGDDGRPVATVANNLAVAGDERLLRTIRARDDGGGVLARLVIEATDARAQVAIEFELQRLSPDRAPLPGAEVRDLEPGGARSGRVRLFPEQPWRHPTWCSFDVVTLDRDHLSWSAGRPRGIVLLAGGRLTRREASDEAFGFWRSIEVAIDAGSRSEDPAAAVWLDWHERKADQLAPAGAVVRRDCTALLSNGEPAPGAWCIARDTGRACELPAAAFSVQADLEGEVGLPIEARADATAVEVIAFTAGARARFGRRLGAIAPTGSGCILLLEERATTFVQVDPPPLRPTWIGLHVATGAFLIPLAADGTVHLPALGEEATLHLGAPYVRNEHRLRLAPDERVAIAGALLPGG
ncbi:MAG: hypothetical protein EXS13_04690 [Planctomycetes bacterium]|nr:hypothetical protein [Planctomycetota bacterium]